MEKRKTSDFEFCMPNITCLHCQPQGALAKHVVIHEQKEKAEKKEKKKGEKTWGEGYGFHTGSTDMRTVIKVMKSGEWAKRVKI